ncbi:MAG: tRNA (adenosine(37)-N6)-dimethylallyltransferase MiaA [Bacteroidetes bacterium]|nr:tRNA (adenosine(37)-N6)-dimethylallyltransferase MiaA [Bacteroidota bacterium]
MSDEQIKTIIICGPTATGKTEISLELNKYLDIEIISADSRQIYKHLNIGTAKPTTAELNSTRHHFIDILNPDEDYSAGKFGNDAYSVLSDINKRGKIPVIVGGAGLYIKALIEGFFVNDDELDNNANAQIIREQLENDLKEKGIDNVYNELKIVDPPLYELYSDKNPRRIIRALQYYKQYGKRLSDDWKEKQNRKNIIPYYFCIDEDRDVLYNKINKRVIKMCEMGLVNEIENVLKMGYDASLNSLNSVGYKEIINYLNGIFSKDTAIEEIQKNTRHYAKRQVTWFKKYTNVNFIKKEKIIYEIKKITFLRKSCSL